MKDKVTGDLVWSNSYWYSGLELHTATETCVRNGITQLGKIVFLKNSLFIYTNS